MSIYDEESVEIAKLQLGDVSGSGEDQIAAILAILKLPDYAVIVRTNQVDGEDGITFHAVRDDD